MIMGLLKFTNMCFLLLFNVISESNVCGLYRLKGCTLCLCECDVSLFRVFHSCVSEIDT